jgi:hypothetical protein
MKKRAILLTLLLLVLAISVATVLAKGSKNGTLVIFEYTDEQGIEYYCEGHFLQTASGIVHEWRDNVECVNWGLPMYSFQLVFKPTDKFDNEGWEEEGLLGCYAGPWMLTDAYVDLDGDQGDLSDFFGEPNEQTYWVCVYSWESE